VLIRWRPRFVTTKPVTDSPSELLRLSATRLAPGDVLGGKYRVDRLLGAGGMGVVLSATHLELEAPVAIKVVRDEYARNEEVVARMLFEARAVAKLKSSHVVRVVDVARLESGAPYIVMERLEGSDLAKLLVERGTLPVQEAVDYVLQACEGLAEAHALGIVHRDLKPENLYLANTREGPVVKVLDFGISKEIGEGVAGMSLSPRSVMTTAGYAVGSPYYMSPEQMRAGEVDARTDVWALGAILYELLSGRCPFEGESLAVVCARVLGDDEAAPLASMAPGTPEGLSSVVACCLRKNREERFGSVEEVVTALRAFASLDGQRSAARLSRPISGDSRLRLVSDRPMGTPPPMAATASVPPSRSASGRYLPIAAALALVASLAVGWAAQHSPVPAPPPSRPAALPVPAVAARGVEIQVAPSVPAVIAPAPPTSSPSSVVSAEPSQASRGAKRPPAARAAASTPSIAKTGMAKPPTSGLPSTKPPADAWDPDRLGGRY
jgi:eukaryotic-like serine/threonine-protein kinase